jgi:copper chaperone CopZ
MKKNIFLILFAMVSLAFAANAQSCCSSKSKDKASCSKKIATTQKAAINGEAKAVFVSSTFVQEDKTEKFTVYGNCGMCEKTIENALKDVDGISKADWDRETDEMTVVFNSKKISLDDIKQKIADVGYDTDSHRAKEEVYNSLPGCCQYERPSKKLD